MAKEPLGITFDVLSDQEAIGVYEDENGVDVFETDAPYLLSDGKSLEAPLPVRVVDGPVFPDSMGNAQSAFPVNGLTPPQEWDPTDLFANGDPGFVLPVDPQFLFQNAAGTIPVTAPGQPVGLRLDISRMGGKSLAAFLAGQPELRAAGAGTPSGGWSENAGVVTAPGTNGQDNVTFPLVTPTVAGRRYLVTIPNTMPASGFYADFGSGTGSQVGNFSSNVQQTILTCTAPGSIIRIGRWAGSPSGSIGPISVKEIPGNHFIQTTDSARPAYQIDGNGKPCVVYDGGDDFMVSAANVDFSGTDEMMVAAGLHKASDAAVGMFVEHSSNAGTNNGSFYLSAPHDTGAASVQVASRGTSNAIATYTHGSVAAPVTLVAVGEANINTPFSRLRTNGVERASDTASQGTGNYGSHLVYLGRRGGSSLPFNGRDYGITVLGRLPTDKELAQVEAYYAKAAGVTL